MGGQVAADRLARILGIAAAQVGSRRLQEAGQGLARALVLALEAQRLRRKHFHQLLLRRTSSAAAPPAWCAGAAPDLHLTDRRAMKGEQFEGEHHPLEMNGVGAEAAQHQQIRAAVAIAAGEGGHGDPMEREPSRHQKHVGTVIPATKR